MKRFWSNLHQVRLESQIIKIKGGEPESHLQIKIYRPNQLYSMFTVTVQIRKWRQLVMRG